MKVSEDGFLDEYWSLFIGQKGCGGVGGRLWPARYARINQIFE